jgi:hypothetical protein
MLAPDSLVTDLIFRSDVELEPEALLDALGGEEAVAKLKILDPDMQDPRLEMELSPSMPFRRRGERRLLIIDDSFAPMRKDPRTESVVPVDLRDAKDHLISLCETLPIRCGRLFALGSWGDAVLIARSGRDLRGISLISWAIDPLTDLEGRRRASPLTQSEFEEKLLSFDKRLDELDEKEILASIGPAKFERRDELLILDVLEDDGTWDLKKSLEMEQSIAAVDRFSMLPGARSAPRKKEDQATSKAAGPDTAEAKAPSAPEPASPPPEKPSGPAIRVAEIEGSVVFIFPPERWDLDIAAALGKRDWDAIFAQSDEIAGKLKDNVYEHGAEFVAPVEFLSEVFVDGKPLSKADFEKNATRVGDAQTLEVHFPRFGAVQLFARDDGSRFVTSSKGNAEQILALLP